MARKNLLKNKMSINQFFFRVTLPILIIAVLVGGGFLFDYVAQGFEDTVTFTVMEKERVHSRESRYYLVFTSNEVFQNADSVYYWKFNSSDIYGKMEKGKTYSAVVFGMRVPFLSMYRNIISVQEVKASNES